MAVSRSRPPLTHGSLLPPVQTWVIWSKDPHEWLPINHSCEPSTWVEGLNLVAKRHVRKGEAISIEYASFNAPSMTPFNCE